MNKEQLQQHIKELEDKAQSIWNEAKIAKNQLAALDNKDIEAILPQCRFTIKNRYIFVHPVYLKDDLFLKRSHGYNHFDFPLTGDIQLHVDDEDIKLHYTNLQMDASVVYGIKNILTYLHSVGVPKANISNNIDSEIKGMKRSLQGLEEEKFIQDKIIEEVYGN